MTTLPTISQQLTGIELQKYPATHTQPSATHPEVTFHFIVDSSTQLVLDCKYSTESHQSVLELDLFCIQSTGKSYTDLNPQS